jgi:hypothetical protein
VRATSRFLGLAGVELALGLFGGEPERPEPVGMVGFG